MLSDAVLGEEETLVFKEGLSVCICTCLYHAAIEEVRLLFIPSG